MKVIKEDIRVCGVDVKMVSERLGWREKMRILTTLAKDKDGVQKKE